MWLTRDLDDADGHEDGKLCMKRQTDLWAQWSKVVELMLERDPEKVERNMGGFAKE